MLNSTIPLIKIGRCILVIVAITSTMQLYLHPYISAKIMGILNGVTTHEQPIYPRFISVIAFTYFTSFISVGLIVFLYYQANHLIKIKSKLLKALFVLVLVLEIYKGLHKGTD